MKCLLEAGKLLNSIPIKNRDTISSDTLKALCDVFKHTEDVLYLRDLTMILLGYEGFLRFNEINKLKCNDIEFKEDHMILKIRKSKTDVYRSGKDVFIAKCSSTACPQSMLYKYLRATEQDVKSDKFLFRPVNRSKGKAKLLVVNKKMSFTIARECIVGKLRLVAPDLN